MRISKIPTSSHSRISSVSQQPSLKRRPKQLTVASNRQLKRLCMALQICSTVIGHLENGNKQITKQVKNLVREQRPAKNQDRERLATPHKLQSIQEVIISKSRNRHIIHTTERSVLTTLDSRVKVLRGLNLLIFNKTRSHTRCGNREFLRSPIPLFSMLIRK